MAGRYQRQEQEQQQDPGEPAAPAEGTPAAPEAPAAAPGRVAGGTKGKTGNRTAKPTKTLEQRWGVTRTAGSSLRVAICPQWSISPVTRYSLRPSVRMSPLR